MTFHKMIPFLKQALLAAVASTTCFSARAEVLDLSPGLGLLSAIQAFHVCENIFTDFDAAIAQAEIDGWSESEPVGAMLQARAQGVRMMELLNITIRTYPLEYVHMTGRNCSIEVAGKRIDPEAFGSAIEGFEAGGSISIGEAGERADLHQWSRYQDGVLTTIRFQSQNLNLLTSTTISTSQFRIVEAGS